ncbi:50S ribosomal protein L4 [Leptolinea tardivitalis]|uniref:Large ribosomal subunit protein uL4 n=1 Tax=Leptolinea tardivitalis TaxID=229920 RepID=A0A0P6WY87_9CHLR|nr:50S ribosomal protein L4 [Leptolinea tardivitalis]KPL71513.1 50S ribosomal protein L4 [Leptolinea tardivitalis]GAP19821.1 50S ribosomal protein L4 [Leptolinea tardivitalis]
MQVDVLNMEGKKVRTVELPASVFEAPINLDLMHQAFQRQMANARLGTHQTKTRSEVSGGGKKPWHQKGTGRARQGSSRSPVWKGGGGAHTPHPHLYTQAMPLKMRRAAVRSALTVKAQEANIVVVDELKLNEPKTRLMASALNNLVGQASALVLIPEKNESSEWIVRSTNNLPDAKVLMAGYLNIRDLMVFDKLVLPLAALDVIATNLG